MASYDHQPQRQLPAVETPGGFSSWKSKDGGVVINSLSHHVPAKKSKVEEADEDLFTVPEVETLRAGAADPATAQSNNQPDGQIRNGPSGKRRRGRNPIDKEHKRLKRLLRNRVSAQQARERKKVYVSDLESRAGELQETNSMLQEKISTLTNENAMLRKILMNSRPKVDQNAEEKQ